MRRPIARRRSGHAADVGQRRSRRIRSSRAPVGSGWQHADVQHPESSGVGHVQHGDRPTVGHAGAGRRRRRSRTSSSRCRTAPPALRCPRSRSRCCRLATGSATVNWTRADDQHRRQRAHAICAAIAWSMAAPSSRWTSRATVNNPGLTTYTVDNLSSGHVVLRGVRREHRRRARATISNVATKTIP